MQLEAAVRGSEEKGSGEGVEADESGGERLGDDVERVCLLVGVVIGVNAEVAESDE